MLELKETFPSERLGQDIQGPLTDPVGALTLLAHPDYINACLDVTSNHELYLIATRQICSESEDDIVFLAKFMLINRRISGLLESDTAAGGYLDWEMQLPEIESLLPIIQNESNPYCMGLKCALRQIIAKDPLYLTDDAILSLIPVLGISHEVSFGRFSNETLINILNNTRHSHYQKIKDEMQCALVRNDTEAFAGLSNPFMLKLLPVLGDSLVEFMVKNRMGNWRACSELDDICQDERHPLHGPIVIEVTNQLISQDLSMANMSLIEQGLPLGLSD